MWKFPITLLLLFSLKHRTVFSGDVLTSVIELTEEKFTEIMENHARGLIGKFLEGNEAALEDSITRLSADIAERTLNSVCVISIDVVPFNWLTKLSSIVIDELELTHLKNKLTQFINMVCQTMATLITKAINLTTKQLRKAKEALANLIEPVLTEIFTDLLILWMNTHENFSEDTLKMLMKLFTISSKSDEQLPCGGNYTPYIIFWKHLTALSVAEFKGLIIYISQRITRTLINKLPIPGELEIKKSSLTAHITKWQFIVAKVALTTEMEHHLCDAVEQPPERDNEYLEMERLYQRMFVYEKKAFEPNTCDNTCGDIDLYNYTQKDDIFQGQCKGRINSCWGDYGSITVCRNDNNHSSPRRYEWFETTATEQVAGKKTECNTIQYQDSIDVHSFFLIPKCNFCICRCTENFGYSDESTFMFSNEPMVSNIRKNRVIVGIGFEKVDHIIYMKILEGEINGNVSIKGNATWVHSKYLNRKNILAELKNHYNPDYMAKKGVIVVSDEDEMKTNQVSMSNGRCSKNQFVTGVRLDYLSTNMSKIIAVHVKCCNVIRKTSKLDQRCNLKTGWTNELSKTEIENLKHLSVWDKDSPLNSLRETKVDSTKKHFIKFVESGWPDGGQTTVPLIDPRTVMFDKPAPLTSVGLYHRGTPENAGFIGLIIAGNQKIQMRRIKKKRTISKRNIDSLTEILMKQ